MSEPGGRTGDKARRDGERKRFTVRFWGARGTMASTDARTDRYGGNTACLEVRCGEQTLILDAGSGLRLLGDRLLKRAAKAARKGHPAQRLHLFFTHCHYDHISGLPFFGPFFDASAQVAIWSGHLEGPDKTQRMILDYMRPPYFPVGPEVFRARIEYRDFEPGDRLEPEPGIVLSTLSLDHHDGCVGYRVDFDGRSVCYITDTTHTPGRPDQGIIDICRDTELMIYDGTYTDAEFPQFADFGHSTWEEGLRLAMAAGAKRYCIFHHRPSRSDKALDRIQARARRTLRRSWAAAEGLMIKV